MSLLVRRPRLFHAIVRRRLVARVADALGIGTADAETKVDAVVDTDVIDAAAQDAQTPAAVAALAAGTIDWQTVLEWIVRIVEVLLPLILAL